MPAMTGYLVALDRLQTASDFMGTKATQEEGMNAPQVKVVGATLVAVLKVLYKVANREEETPAEHIRNALQVLLVARGDTSSDHWNDVAEAVTARMVRALHQLEAR